MPAPRAHRLGGILAASLSTSALVAGSFGFFGTDLMTEKGAAPHASPVKNAPAAVGLQTAADPGPFPASVVPAGGSITIPGEREGESTLPIVSYPQVQPKSPGKMDFEHYHTGIEIEWWLKKWAADHPDIVDLYVVGESFSGKPIYQLTLTNKAAGKDTDKPAAYFEGNRHSGEVTSAEASLWLAWHLIENKDSRQIESLLKDKAIYIRPVNNPDGHDMYL